MVTQAERHIDAPCGCRLYYTDRGEAYETRVEWCQEHQKQADYLRRVIDDLEFRLAEIATRAESGE